jgi:CheY-like chemotaxis protein
MSADGEQNRGSAQLSTANALCGHFRAGNPFGTLPGWAGSGLIANPAACDLLVRFPESLSDGLWVRHTRQRRCSPDSSHSGEGRARNGGKRVSSNPPKERETILIIDDEPSILEVTGDILKTLGYEVLTARSGQEAVHLYWQQAGRIDLVILDMVMTDMGGEDTFDLLKAVRPDVRVILFSGYSMTGQVQRLMDRGCRGFIPKPFRMADLARKVRTVLDQES